MLSVDVRRLGEEGERLVRRARKRRQAIVVTDEGKPIARIEPLETEQPGPEAGAALLADMQRIAADIGRWWPAGADAIGTVREMRHM
jgi:antitoxin (DNA-binding transcriptional repressor) of toxin-antitoxin stability system